VSTSAVRTRALSIVRDQLAAAAAATKCHACGCLHQTLRALAGSSAGGELGDALAAAGRTLTPPRYDCLGCAECYPALAANAFAEAFPEQAGGLDLCPTAPPDERAGWPPLPGDYQVVRYRASVAVCTLGDADLARRLAARAPDGLSIVGTLHTENLGIERLIVNLLANPNIRHLVLCGPDTRQAVGHLPGQSLACLFAAGLDPGGRIVGAPGKRPVLVNVDAGQVAAFRRQVALVALVGETDEARIAEAVAIAHRQHAPPFDEPPRDGAVPMVHASEPRRLVPDPAGFLVVYPEPRTMALVVEHYASSGELTCVVEGATAAAVYAEIIARGLVTRLDHAAYLGRELARAERSLQTGEPYVQDRAAGDGEESAGGSCDCGSSCGGPS